MGVWGCNPQRLEDFFNFEAYTKHLKNAKIIQCQSIQLSPRLLKLIFFNRGACAPLYSGPIESS